MKWKPSKAARAQYGEMMSKIEKFCASNNISHSKSFDSFYFEIEGQKYRVSNHSVEASNAAAEGRQLYHPVEREKDTIYIHASKTRLMQIFNDLSEHKELDGRGYSW